MKTKMYFYLTGTYRLSQKINKVLNVLLENSENVMRMNT